MFNNREGTTMNQPDNDMNALFYKKILLIAEKEYHEIGNGNIDKLEEYGLIKESIMRKLEKLKNSEMLSLNGGTESVEIEKLVKEILMINEKNKKALISLQNDVMVEISSIQSSKKAHKAYSSQTYFQGS